jgi:Sortase domain
MKRLLLCLTLLALSGCGYATAQSEPLASSAPSSVTTSATSEMSAAVPPAAPTRLHLGDIDAPVVPLELTRSALTPPDDPNILGWWGKRAGARHGTTLLTGHTVHDGGGTFDDLELTPLGERAHLNGHSYQVASVDVISKDELAHRAPALFAQTGRPNLVLVTCEDYNPATGHYASNVVVTLDPVR